MAAATALNQAGISRVLRRIDTKVKAAREADRTVVTVGVHAEEGSVDEGGGVTVATVAAFAELGTSRQPRRSWLADTIDEEERAIREGMRRVGAAVLQKTERPDVAYLQFGELVVRKIQARIRAKIAPANAPLTIARKGSSTPLIDEGRFIASIRAKVAMEPT